LPGPSPAYLLTAVLKGGKTSPDGKKGYAGCLRAKDPLLCPQGALGRHLVTRFTLDGEAFPDPADRHTWVHTALWTGQDPQASVEYTTCVRNFAGYLEDAEVVIKKKMHAFRVYAARLMDEAGVDDEVSCGL
jgi:hypothetical protein